MWFRPLGQREHHSPARFDHSFKELLSSRTNHFKSPYVLIFSYPKRNQVNLKEIPCFFIRHYFLVQIISQLCKSIATLSLFPWVQFLFSTSSSFCNTITQSRPAIHFLHFRIVRRNIQKEELTQLWFNSLLLRMLLMLVRLDYIHRDFLFLLILLLKLCCHISFFFIIGPYILFIYLSGLLKMFSSFCANSCKCLIVQCSLIYITAQCWWLIFSYCTWSAMLEFVFTSLIK